MDEYVDILDRQGRYTGKVLLKSEAHAKGLFHPTIHVWLYTPDGKILLQKRAKTKLTFPGHWDVSVAGHMGAGERPEETAVRETEEELGIRISAARLHKAGVFSSVKKHSPELIDCEFHHVFACLLTSRTEDLRLQETEVEEVRLFGIDDVLRHLRSPSSSGRFVIQPDPYYKEVFSFLTRLIDQKASS
ncbi:NUDIX hydrolase [Sinomicrobium soli]|uniref:NUDIX hydrolase n=1 Tax=Sinomicrobium sp. N-1-3-6 TaxID=2219864 RepID=UPI000DCDCB01|nr:NUDIX domain-containing protein [Sinomicrobium sp. N-1-3-6]RAV28369.1 hydrolase [Sinomicrobium sp. N-1-3-6]